MREKTDVLIIGAGVLGCFAARSLSRYKLDIAVVEQREDVCTGISRANTGIIYQGYDQHPGTIKAALCRRASEGFPALCAELDIPYKKRGLLMLSFGEHGDRVLEQKLRQGAENGVAGIRILDKAEVYEKEPFLCGGIRHALYAENTYVVNPWEMGIAAFENARANGAAFYFNEKAVRICRENGRFLVETQARTFETAKILICAGRKGDLVWELAEKPRIRILPKAADYLVFDTTTDGMIRHVISVEPEEKGDGITLVPTVDGNILAGPTRRAPAAASETATAAEGLAELRRKCRQLIPELSMDQIIRSFAGVRPNPYLLGEDGSISDRSLKDFILLEEDGLFAMIGIKTPGLTCAQELGMYMAERIAHSFASVPEEKPIYDPARCQDEGKAFDPARKGILRVSAMIGQDPEGFAKLPSAYHEILCRCRNTSKGEVLEAIRRGAVTLDGVKRRTGAGSGRCQGGYCMEKILQLLAETMGHEHIIL